jgi:hypothetical protein
LMDFKDLNECLLSGSEIGVNMKIWGEQEIALCDNLKYNWLIFNVLIYSGFNKCVHSFSFTKTKQTNNQHFTMDNSRHNYMQKDVNIRISNECKTSLIGWKKNYFTTFNECISQIHYFFRGK